jgi:site-specific DNA-methyltransferase (adenine-specific)
VVNIDLRLGDCLDIMPTLEVGSIDAILTDIPYGTTACAWDEIIPFEPMWAQVKRVLKPRGVFVTTASQPFTSKLVMSNLDWFKYEWVWNKKSKTDVFNAKNKPLKQHENIIVFSPGTTANCSDKKMTYNPIGVLPPTRNNPNNRKAAGYMGNARPSHIENYSYQGSNYPSSIIVYSNANRNDVTHPTQKPVALYKYLTLTYTNEGDTVLDFCMGSGTTGVACVQTGRNFIGIEKKQEYYEIAEKRIAEAQMQLRLAI